MSRASLFSLAGFQVTFNGRFWVTTEGMKRRSTGRAFLESIGEGVRRILKASEVHAGRRPVHELFGEEVRLTIWTRPSSHQRREDVP